MGAALAARAVLVSQNPAADGMRALGTLI